MQHPNIDLYSCITSQFQQFFKRVFYLKQIIVITGAPFQREDRGNYLRCPPSLNPALGACERPTLLFAVILHRTV